MIDAVLTVVSFSAARKSRTPITQLVADHLRPEPTLLALLADRYTSESSLRPFAPLADKQLRAWEGEALRKLETLLSRLLPPQPASAPRPPPPPDPGPSRDRFEL